MDRSSRSAGQLWPSGRRCVRAPWWWNPRPHRSRSRPLDRRRDSARASYIRGALPHSRKRKKRQGLPRLKTDAWKIILLTRTHGLQCTESIGARDREFGGLDECPFRLARREDGERVNGAAAVLTSAFDRIGERIGRA